MGRTDITPLNLHPLPEAHFQASHSLTAKPASVLTPAENREATEPKLPSHLLSAIPYSPYFLISLWEVFCKYYHSFGCPSLPLHHTFLAIFHMYLETNSPGGFNLMSLRVTRKPELRIMINTPIVNNSSNFKDNNEILCVKHWHKYSLFSFS